MFWRNFIALCTKAKTPPSRVATDLGLTKSAVTGWKKGATPHESTLARIADYFGVPVEALTASGAPAPDAAASAPLEPDEARLLADYRGFSYAGRGLIRDFIERMKAAGIYAYGADPFLLGLDSDG